MIVRLSLVLAVFFASIGAFGQVQPPGFIKIEPINEQYSIGFKKWNAEHLYHYYPYILSSTDTIAIENLNGWILHSWYNSLNGELASFEIYKLENTVDSDGNWDVSEESGVLTMNLETAEILNWHFEKSVQSSAFVKVEKVNETYSIGYKSYDEEFQGYGDMSVISEHDTLPISDISTNICNLWNVSPNGRFAFFETLSMGWVEVGDSTFLHDKWYGALVDLKTADVIQHCTMDCGDEWNEKNQWLSSSEVIFDPLEYPGAMNFTEVVSVCTGDLNNDNFLDSVVVMQDTIHELWPYRLEIYFADAEGGMTLISQTYKSIPVQYPNTKQGLWSGSGFSSISIVRGILLLEVALLRGNVVHKFRYQNDGFELIGYTRHESDGRGKLYFTDFNLSTGEWHQEIEYYSSDEPKEVQHDSKWIRPLPNLEFFEPFGNEDY